ncbi:MAG: Rossmann-like and DUF2520 domain-containing protein [Bacteroidota bacterium]|nr:Rossmann-like and DUF2520 domain-containing protein [Bacteroidota bacterium]
MPDPIQDIVFVGSGNLATRLALSFGQAGLNIVQVFSPEADHAAELAAKVNADPVSSYNSIRKNADLYVIAVKDHAIQDAARRLKPERGIMVHTSGSQALDALSLSSLPKGVFYPLNTFSKNKHLDFKNTPVCIEAADDNSRNLLMDLGSRISGDVREISSEQRLMIHTAAVFASNFVNHLYAISSDILKKGSIPFDIMLPIIGEVAEKAGDQHPDNAQTGPALREDHVTLTRHLEVLKDFREYRNLYELMSKSIIKRHKS